MAELPLVTVDPDTVARAIIRAVRAKNPKPRYIVGPAESLAIGQTAADRPDVGSAVDAEPQRIAGSSAGGVGQSSVPAARAKNLTRAALVQRLEQGRHHGSEVCRKR